MSQARFQKQQREKNRREKAAEKRDRKAARAEAASSESPIDPDAASATQPQVLAELAALHAQFEDGALDFEAFEERKLELLAKLDV